jgi:hypothetical protein
MKFSNISKAKLTLKYQTHILYFSGSQPLWNRGLVNSIFIRRGSGTGPRPGGWESLLYLSPALNGMPVTISEQPVSLFT